MSQLKTFAKKLSQRLEKKQDDLPRFPATMGDGQGHLYFGASRLSVYVRIGSKIAIATCTRIQPADGLAVWVGYVNEEKTTYQVLSTRGKDPTNTTIVSGGYAPASRYRFLEKNGGQDPLWLEKRAWLPLRVGMTNPTSMSVRVLKGDVWNGTVFLHIQEQLVDLTSHIPSTEDKAALVLISVDDAGDIIDTKGDEVDIDALCPAGDEFANCPDIPEGTVELLALIRVYYGQTVIQEGRTNTDFIDLRGLYGVGGDGGGGVESVTGDGVDNTDPANPVLSFPTPAELSIAVDDLTDVDTTSDPPAKDEVLKWNGSNWVPAAYNASFEFSIASFSDGESSPQEIGDGVWKAIGEISFTATYNNGPAAATPYVSKSGWSNLNMTGEGYVGPTTNAEAVNYPSVGASITFQLNATDGEDADTETQSVAFYNRRYWGVSETASGFDEADIEGLADDELSNSKAKTFTVNAGAGEYIIFAYPSRLGTATFTVGGFEGGFEEPETVSVENASGYTEDYYVYRSTNSGLGSTTVTTS